MYFLSLRHHKCFDFCPIELPSCTLQALTVFSGLSKNRKKPKGHQIQKMCYKLLEKKSHICKLPCRPGPGGRQCQKASVEHKACEGPPCPKGAPSFRDLQCLSYDRHASKKKGNMLTAVMNEGEVHSTDSVSVCVRLCTRLCIRRVGTNLFCLFVFCFVNLHIF